MELIYFNDNISYFLMLILQMSFHFNQMQSLKYLDEFQKPLKLVFLICVFSCGAWDILFSFNFCKQITSAFIYELLLSTENSDDI